MLELSLAGESLNAWSCLFWCDDGQFLDLCSVACIIHDRSVPSKLKFLRTLDTSTASAEGANLILIVSILDWSIITNCSLAICYQAQII